MINRTLLPLVAIMVLVLAGSALAQTAPVATDQPSTATTQSATVEPSTGETAPATQPTSPPPSGQPADTSAPPQATQSSTGTLPATASNNPLMFLVGIAAIVAFVTLLVYRRHGAARS